MTRSDGVDQAPGAQPRSRTRPPSPLIELSVLETARELATLGATTRTITSLTGLSVLRARSLLRAVQGRVPPRGNRPRLARSLLAGETATRDATLFVHLYRFHASHRGCSRARALIDAYRVGRRTRLAYDAEYTLDLDEAYRLLGLIEHGVLALTTCPGCGLELLADACDRACGRASAPSCPFCSLLRTKPESPSHLSRYAFDEESIEASA